MLNTGDVGRVAAHGPIRGGAQNEQESQVPEALESLSHQEDELLAADREATPPAVQCTSL